MHARLARRFPLVYAPSKHGALSSPLLAAMILLAGCSTASRSESGKSPEDSLQTQMTEMRAALATLSGRLDSMDGRIGVLNDRITGTQASLEMLTANHKPVPTPVAGHPSEGTGSDPALPMASNDPEAGFVTDSAVQDYRKASILLQARKYPEAVLAFSAFVEKYPDHALAGSAQYGIGSAYFKQKEYKLAVREYERVLTSYDRSPHVSDTLRDLADAEEALKLTEQAARHRQLLSSLFPQSPAAGGREIDTASHEVSPAPGAPALPQSATQATPPTTTALAAPAAPEGMPTAPITAPADEGASHTEKTQ